MISSRRLAKELAELKGSGMPEGCALLRADDLETWVISIAVLGESLYAGQTFALRFRFSRQYPLDSPETVFLNSGGFKPPVHPHVYTNGHICASILTNTGSAGWSPVLNVAAVVLTMQSMLASNTKLELPPDNSRYVASAPASAKDTRWEFHDDTV